MNKLISIKRRTPDEIKGLMESHVVSLLEFLSLLGALAGCAALAFSFVFWEINWYLVRLVLVSTIPPAVLFLLLRFRIG